MEELLAMFVLSFAVLVLATVTALLSTRDECNDLHDYMKNRSYFTYTLSLLVEYLSAEPVKVQSRVSPSLLPIPMSALLPAFH